MLVTELKRIIKIFSSSSPVAVINFDLKSAVISAGQIFIKFNICTEECDKRGVTFSCSDIKLSALKGVKSVSFSSDGDSWEMYNSETGDTVLSGNCPELSSPIPTCTDARTVSTISLSELQALIMPKVKTSFPVFIYGMKDGLAAMYMDPICCQLSKVNLDGQTSPFSVGIDKKVIEISVKAASIVPDGDWGLSLFKCWDMPFILMSSNGFEIMMPCVPKKAPSAIKFFKGAASPKIKTSIPLGLNGDRVCVNTYDGSARLVDEKYAPLENEHIVSLKALKTISFLDDNSECGISSSEGYLFINSIIQSKTLNCAVIGEY